MNKGFWTIQDIIKEIGGHAATQFYGAWFEWVGVTAGFTVAESV